MPVHLSPPDAASLHPVSGVRIGVAEAGIRKAGRKDLTVMLIDEPGRTSAPWSSTRAAPTRARGQRGWKRRAAPATRWPRSWACGRSRCCRFQRA